VLASFELLRSPCANSKTFIGAHLAAENGDAASQLITSNFTVGFALRIPPPIRHKKDRVHEK
jgi:hypothetical protein